MDLPLDAAAEGGQPAAPAGGAESPIPPHVTVARRAANAAKDPAAAARAAELMAMSESFRDGVLLSAIRDAGYLCYTLLSSRMSGDDHPIWAVRCDDVLAYLVGIDVSGKLVVEPLLLGDFGIDARPVDPNRRPLPLE
jgi:hypothetical protein